MDAASGLRYQLFEFVAEAPRLRAEHLVGFVTR